MSKKETGKLFEKLECYLYATHELGTIAGACQPSRWAVTLMDVHSLGKGV